MYLPMYLALLGCAVTVLLLFAALAVTNKSIFTMGVRNIIRRPKSAAIIVGALLVSTAIISGSLVASSSLGYSVVKATYDALGNVDETVALNGQPFNYSVYQHVAADSSVNQQYRRHLSEPLRGGPVCGRRYKRHHVNRSHARRFKLHSRRPLWRLCSTERHTHQCERSDWQPSPNQRQTCSRFRCTYRR